MICVLPPALYVVCAVLLSAVGEYFDWWLFEEGVIVAAILISGLGSLMVPLHHPWARVYGHFGLLFGLSVLAVSATGDVMAWGGIPWLGFAIFAGIALDRFVGELGHEYRPPEQVRGFSCGLAFGGATLAVLCGADARNAEAQQFVGCLIVAALMYGTAWFLVRKRHKQKRRR